MEEDLLEARRRELGHGVLDFARGRGVELARDGDGDLVASGTTDTENRVYGHESTTALNAPSGIRAEGRRSGCARQGAANACGYVRARTTAGDSARTVLE